MCIVVMFLEAMEATQIVEILRQNSVCLTGLSNILHSYNNDKFVSCHLSVIDVLETLFNYFNL